MFDSIRRLFGEGTVRVEGLVPGQGKFVAKIPYTGDVNTLDENELFDIVKRKVLVEYGVRVVDLKIIGWC